MKKFIFILLIVVFGGLFSFQTKKPPVKQTKVTVKTDSLPLQKDSLSKSIYLLKNQQKSVDSILLKKKTLPAKK